LSLRSSFILVICIALGGCVVAPFPMAEYTISRSAVTSAKESGAERLAPGLWYKAEENYRRGQKFLKDKDNESAKAAFIRAIDFAEKAENASRLKKFETGESFQ
jgi:Domain of unknown function (DUF4398)